MGYFLGKAQKDGGELILYLIDFVLTLHQLFLPLLNQPIQLRVLPANAFDPLFDEVDEKGLMNGLHCLFVGVGGLFGDELRHSGFAVVAAGNDLSQLLERLLALVQVSLLIRLVIITLCVLSLRTFPFTILPTLHLRDY